MLLSNEEYKKKNVYWTLDFVLSANYYIYQCAAKPIIVVSWGLPFDIDETDNIYKFNIQMANGPYKVVQALASYIHYVYVCSYKDICVIPFEHLDYIAGDYLTYKTFTDALQEAEEYYSLKIHTGTLDEENWESEYICIQKKDKKIK